MTTPPLAQALCDGGTRRFAPPVCAEIVAQIGAVMTEDPALSAAFCLEWAEGGEAEKAEGGAGISSGPVPFSTGNPDGRHSCGNDSQE